MGEGLETSVGRFSLFLVRTVSSGSLRWSRESPQLFFNFQIFIFE